MRPLIALVISIFIPSIFLSQGFTNVSEDQGIDIINSNPFFGAGVSFYDFDKDGWDDLTFCLKNQALTFYKNNNGTFEEQTSFFNPNKDVKSAVWVDYDNDGDADLMVCVSLGQSTLFRNDGDWNFTDVTIESGMPQVTNARTFGQSWGDYDKDGFLDVYICHVDQLPIQENWLMHNNGDGTFTNVAQDLGVDNGFHITFQSTWLDYNNDSWPDLYIINEGITPNELFANNGDGTFTNVSTESGAGVGIDAMSNAVCDYDNDGDLDIYITNNPNGNVLLSNNSDGTFTNLASSAGLLYNVFSWGALWIDFDNDLDDDLHIVNNSPAVNYVDAFYENNADGTFSEISTDLGLSLDHPVSYSNVKGDFNNDGFYDIAIANAAPTTSYLYENDGGDNHYIKLSLEGVVSNRDAIGTWTTTYIGLNKYVEYTMCGENYLGQDSQYEIISLGENTAVDSIEIAWPSGLYETYYDVQGDQTVYYLEGATLSYPISYTGDLALCEGDSVVLDAGIGTSYEWSNGDTAQFITVFESGDYSVSLLNPDNFPITLDAVSISVFENPEISSETVDNICFGEENGSITLLGDGIEDIVELTWETGDTTLMISNLGAGSYSYEILDQNGCIIISSAEVLEADSLCHSPIVIDVYCYGGNNGSIDIDFCGGTPPYSTQFEDGDMEPDSLFAGTYNMEIVDAMGCSVSMDIVVSEPDVLTADLTLTYATEVEATGSATIDIMGGTAPYEILWSTGSDEDGIFELEPGDYNVQVTDINGCTITLEFTIELFIGINDLLENDNITIYPNPVDETLNISMEKNWGDVQVFIFNLNGKLVMKSVINNKESNLNLSSLEAASYVIEIKNEEKILMKELVIKK